MINERGGVEGYKIKPVYADAQSKPDVAINEAERLLDQEKVDMLLGVFSSAHACRWRRRPTQAKKFMWANVCVASAVLKDKNLQLRVPRRRCIPTSSAKPLHLPQRAGQGQARQGAEGPARRDHLRGRPLRRRRRRRATRRRCKKLGMQVVLKEGYAATAPDLSPLVTKLKRARPDVILHTGYNPDITLFLRQAREQGLNWPR